MRKRSCGGRAIWGIFFIYLYYVFFPFYCIKLGEIDGSSKRDEARGDPRLKEQQGRIHLVWSGDLCLMVKQLEAGGTCYPDVIDIPIYGNLLFLNSSMSPVPLYVNSLFPFCPTHYG